MGWLSGACSAISSALSSACSAVSSAVSSVCSAVGSAMSSAFSGIMGSLGGVAGAIGITGVLQALSVAIPYLKAAMAVVQVIDILFQALGLANEKETTEDFGQDVLDAYEAGIKPADYSTYEEYVQAIRAFKLEKPEKVGEYEFAEKFSAGLAIQSWGMEEKFGKDSSLILTTILKDSKNINEGTGYFTPDRMDTILKTVHSVSDVVKYFSGKLSVDDQEKVEQQLVKAEQQLNPDKSLSQIYQELDKQRQND